MPTETTYAIILPIWHEGATLEGGAHLPLAEVSQETIERWQAHGLIVEDPPAEPIEE